MDYLLRALKYGYALWEEIVTKKLLIVFIVFSFCLGVVTGAFLTELAYRVLAIISLTLIFSTLLVYLENREENQWKKRIKTLCFQEYTEK
jgi:uncharacterized membrane protein YoaK (UPF0700 family)